MITCFEFVVSILYIRQHLIFHMNHNYWGFVTRMKLKTFGDAFFFVESWVLESDVKHHNEDCTKDKLHNTNNNNLHKLYILSELLQNDRSLLWRVAKLDEVDPFIKSYLIVFIRKNLLVNRFFFSKHQNVILMYLHKLLRFEHWNGFFRTNSNMSSHVQMAFFKTSLWIHDRVKDFTSNN